MCLLISIIICHKKFIPPFLSVLFNFYLFRINQIWPKRKGLFICLFSSIL
nr:MAG TPA: hypothetical protein [Caudoviricetes sp.]